MDNSLAMEEDGWQWVLYSLLTPIEVNNFTLPYMPIIALFSDSGTIFLK